MTVIGLDFVALQVSDLDRAAAFYEKELGLKRAPFSPPHAVVYATEPIPFALREPRPGLDLTAGPAGLGVALWMLADDSATLHASLVSHGVAIASPPAEGPFGLTFSLVDPDGYVITVHDKA
jgi:predicted enzyme related to lactoylglutathione lyase